jgi:hypothetical protein
MTTRDAYEKVGGHAAVKSSLHDGLTLPRAYRNAGFFTDICDATHLATCRMYRSASAVWNGLAKNAREGMASNGQIGFWTMVLLCGQVLPVALTLGMYATGEFETGLAFNGIVLMNTVVRFSQDVHFRVLRVGWKSLDYFFWLAVRHPIGVLLLLVIQWYAIVRAVVGKPVGWKGRARPK